MPPEQKAGGSASVDQRADVYSLGAILEWMIGPDAPRALLAICRKATAIAPDGRYADVAALASDVARFVDGAAVSAHSEGVLQRVDQQRRARRTAGGRRYSA